MENNEISIIVENLRSRNFSCISKKIMSEKELLLIADSLKNEEEFSIDCLLSAYTDYKINSNCDWNIGSILQHFDYNSIISGLKKLI